MQGLYGVGAAGAIGLALTQVTVVSVAGSSMSSPIVSLDAMSFRSAWIHGRAVKPVCAGSLFSQCCAASQQRNHVVQGGQSVPKYVADHPSSVWLVGPFFAAITGLAFKEVSHVPVLLQYCHDRHCNDKQLQQRLFGLCTLHYCVQRPSHVNASCLPDLQLACSNLVCVKCTWCCNSAVLSVVCREHVMVNQRQ